jgi:hypothetical protein
MRQFEFPAARYRHRHAKYATGVLEHEIDLLGGDFFGCYYEVALILAVLVVDNNHHFAFGEVGDGILNLI